MLLTSNVFDPLGGCPGRQDIWLQVPASEESIAASWTGGSAGRVR
jgi:hypothetical protein